MDHANHARLTPAELTESNLIGATIYDAQDEEVGSISHLHHMGETRQVVLDVGGFLGIGSKPVMVGLEELDIMRDAHGNVHGVTSMTKEQIEALPEHHH